MRNPLPTSEFILNHLQLAPLSQQAFASPLIRSQHRAIRHWLTRRRTTANSSPLQHIQGLLQAFTHLCDLQEWSIASKLLTLRLNTPTQEDLDHQLGTWGYFSIQQTLYENLLPHAQPNIQPALLTGLGNVHASLSQYNKALNYHQKSLLLARSLGDTQAEETALGNLGGLLYNVGKYEAATAAPFSRWAGSPKAGHRSNSRR